MPHVPNLPAARAAWIDAETEQFATDIQAEPASAAWKRLQIEGAEQAAGETWDQALALWQSRDDADDAFEAVCEQHGEDLAQAIDQALHGPYPKPRPMTSEELAAHDLRMAELAQRMVAEQAEELAARRAA